MADRLPQYPIMPNFNPALMQQQQTQQQQQLNQQQQQQQQQPQDPHQSFTDIGRIWQQPQQIQYNRPPGAGGDINQQQHNSQASFPHFVFPTCLPFYSARAVCIPLQHCESTSCSNTFARGRAVPVITGLAAVPRSLNFFSSSYRDPHLSSDPVT